MAEAAISRKLDPRCATGDYRHWDSSHNLKLPETMTRKTTSHDKMSATTNSPRNSFVRASWKQTKRHLNFETSKDPDKPANVGRIFFAANVGRFFLPANVGRFCTVANVRSCLFDAPAPRA
ncbi:unnamed protein product [Pylaiella littoralis]